jgi:tetratricopeptide (TPR) repeat protein
MIDTLDIESSLAPATDGDIAVTNLESARQHSWNRFWRTPERPGIAELIVEQELLTAQFIGDLSAFDRLEMLVEEFTRAEPEPWRAALVAAQVACSTHRFAESKISISQAVASGAPSDATDRLSLTIDQATGANLPAILAARRERVAQLGRWEDWVPLGALVADIGEFDEAERIYLRALQEYPDVSPFALAWVCFQLGALWGELVPKPQSDRAAHWYRSAITYIPCYVKARVHLSEIWLDHGRTEDARALLAEVLASGDPEVYWRLADVAAASGDHAEAAAYLRAARSGFEALIAKHALAFADHGAEFYADTVGNLERALSLAQLNLANRPTLRAFEQAYATALAAGKDRIAAELRADADTRWGNTAVFQWSLLAVGPAAVAVERGQLTTSLMNVALEREGKDAGA